MNIKLNITILILITLIIRIVLSFLPSFEIDLSGWRFWSDRMTTLGPSQFYSKEIFTDNPPGFLYVFWIVGEIQKEFFPGLKYGSIQSDLLLKLPTNIADILTGFLIYLIIKKYRGEKSALFGFLFYTLNPAIFFNSSIMGQFDGSAALFILLAVYLLVERKKPELSVLSFALAWAIKPQAIMIAPILGLLILKSSKSFKWLTSAFVFAVSSLIIYSPFFPGDPLYGLYYVNSKMTGIFTCTSCFTFNFWGIFGNWQNDLIKFANLPLTYWGIILMFLSFIPVFLLKDLSIKLNKPHIYFAAALSVMAAFTFLTRMHERYIFPLFAFLLISAVLLKSKKLFFFYIFYSIFNLINLYFAYAYYSTQLQLPSAITNILSKNFSLLSGAGLLLFLILLTIYLTTIHSFKKPNLNMPKSLAFIYKIPGKKNVKAILIAILIFAAFSRLIRLDFPDKYIFDEVYHAYTAKEYLKGNKDAWSPWGKSEPGVAFEWLHPPISKEMMTSFMAIFNNDSARSWRFPGALLGTFSVYLIYLITKKLFKEERAALIAAFAFSIDGLNFVQSRTGMNDIYLVTFILISILFFIQKKYILSALFMGIATATKWPGVFLLLIYFPALIHQRHFKKMVYFLIIPVIVYFLSYTPYFSFGYSWGDFIELHKQIWGYQTNLKATHNYSSPWWSWPLNLYPVWYFVDYSKDKVANIFASGNIVVFLSGLVALFFTAKEALAKKSKELFLIMAGFLVFWLPWAISPRIMFLYHFAPSVPFLCIALGYQIDKGLHIKKYRKPLLMLLVLMFAFFIFLYPFLTGVFLPKDLVKLFFYTNITKNPF